MIPTTGKMVKKNTSILEQFMKLFMVNLRHPVLNQSCRCWNGWSFAYEGLAKNLADRISRSLCPSVFLSTHLSVLFCLRLFLCLFVVLCDSFVCLSISMCFVLSVCFSVSLSVLLSPFCWSMFCPYISPFVFLFFCLFLSVLIVSF